MKSASSAASNPGERKGKDKWREVESEKGTLENQSLTSRLFAHTAFKVQLSLSLDPSGSRAGPGWDGLWPQEGLIKQHLREVAGGLRPRQCRDEKESERNRH